jgi:hypothetical protein
MNKKLCFRKYDTMSFQQMKSFGSCALSRRLEGCQKANHYNSMMWGILVITNYSILKQGEGRKFVCTPYSGCSNTIFFSSSTATPRMHSIALL